MYDLLVFIGRFQPYHLGHQHVVDQALKLSKQVLVLVGSATSARSARNPFSFDDRYRMIKSVHPTVEIIGLADHTYNDTAWVVQVQDAVKSTLFAKWTPDGMRDLKIGLIGHEKDHSSYYLRMFPDWTSVDVPAVNPLDATRIRKEFFEDDVQVHELAAVTGVPVAKWLQQFRGTEEYVIQQTEYKYLREYTTKYGKGPFLTADSLVQIGGKILLITRGREYGHGLLALPGGFLNSNEKFLDAALRELREETRLRVPVPVLKGSIVSRRVFDDPHRDARARLVTECFHFKLNDITLPEVRGGDDADQAEWFNIADLEEANFFGDHWHIIRIMLNV